MLQNFKNTAQFVIVMSMNDRILRLNSLFARELNGLIRQKFWKEAVLLTITRVEVAPDLSHARIYFSTPREKGLVGCQKFLEKKRGELKRILSQRISLHHFPEFHFYFDRGMVNELRVNQILNEITEKESPTVQARRERG
jgi:ribosome-binding factor A